MYIYGGTWKNHTCYEWSLVCGTTTIWILTRHVCTIITLLLSRLENTKQFLQHSFENEESILFVMCTNLRKQLLDNSLCAHNPPTGSHQSPDLQKHRLTPAVAGSGPQVEFIPSVQSDWDVQTGSLGDTHWISTPGSGQRFTGVLGSRFTKLR